jgi:uncharacterized protein YjiS (DUF1127 family)
METIMTIPRRATLPRSFTGGALPGELGRALRRWWLAYMEWRLQRLAASLLYRMSDRQLRDLGLTRSRIELAARSQAGQHPLLHGRFS